MTGAALLLHGRVAPGAMRQPPSHRRRSWLRRRGWGGPRGSLVSPEGEAVPAGVPQPHRSDRPPPLTKLLGDRALMEISNPCLFRLKERTLQYRFRVKYLPGKRNSAADFLPPYPALKADPSTHDVDLDEDLTDAIAAANLAAVEHDSCVVDEASAAVSNPVYQLLMARVLAGDWADRKSQEVACLRPFYGVRERLAIIQNLMTYTFEQSNVCLVIPEPLRQQVAANLHAGHQGLDSMQHRARQTVYLHGLQGDLQYRRSLCEECDVHAPSQAAEEVIITPPPGYPFQMTEADMLQHDGHICTWPTQTGSQIGTCSSHIKTQLRRYFARWGALEQISTDGGTNVASEEMGEFFKLWGVSVWLSSAQYPQSNGRAEAALKVGKRIIMANTGSGGNLDTDKSSLAMLQYLNTPLRRINKSPAQMAAGRQL
ncbi:uncharacterized protein LOC135218745 [Macrobrachium nipponense]|uniref:uncharacterized protein LOC135218745 n=1 Tax=Macrobrachium nipponense TaxID=159736 RepID=UPI0030C8C487